MHASGYRSVLGDGNKYIPARSEVSPKEYINGLAQPLKYQHEIVLEHLPSLQTYSNRSSIGLQSSLATDQSRVQNREPAINEFSVQQANNPS